MMSEVSTLILKMTLAGVPQRMIDQDLGVIRAAIDREDWAGVRHLIEVGYQTIRLVRRH